MWLFPRICGGDPNKEIFFLFLWALSHGAFFAFFSLSCRKFFLKALDKTERMFYNFKCQSGNLSSLESAFYECFSEGIEPEKALFFLSDFGS